MEKEIGDKQNINENSILSLKCKAKLIKDIIKIQNTMNDEGVVNFNGDDIRLLGVDPAHVCMITQRIPITELEEYKNTYRNEEEKTNIALGFYYDKFLKVFKDIKKTDFIQIDYDNKNDKLITNIGFFNDTIGLVDTAGMPTPKTPNLDLPAHVVLNLKDFYKFLEKAEKISEYILIGTYNKNFYLYAEGDTDETLVKINYELLEKLETPGPNIAYSSLISTDYIKTVVQCLKVHYEKAEIHFNNDNPIKIICSNGTETEVLIAPRIEEEEEGNFDRNERMKRDFVKNEPETTEENNDENEDQENNTEPQDQVVKEQEENTPENNKVDQETPDIVIDVLVLNIIETMNNSEEELIGDFQDIFKEARKIGLTKDQTNEAIDRLLEQKKIYEPVLDHFKLVNIEKIEEPENQTQQYKMKTVIDIIKLGTANNKPIDKEEIIKQAENYKINPDKTIEVLDRLMRNGQIYTPVENSYKLVGYEPENNTETQNQENTETNTDQENKNDNEHVPDQNTEENKKEIIEEITQEINKTEHEPNEIPEIKPSGPITKINGKTVQLYTSEELEEASKLWEKYHKTRHNNILHRLVKRIREIKYEKQTRDISLYQGINPTDFIDILERYEYTWYNEKIGEA